MTTEQQFSLRVWEIMTDPRLTPNERTQQLVHLFRTCQHEVELTPRRRFEIASAIRHQLQTRQEKPR